VIAYGAGGLPAAKILYLAYLHSGTPATLAPATLASVHVLPYRETGPLIIYTLDPKDNRAVNALMAASSLGVRAVLVAPPMHPAVEDLIAQLAVERITVPAGPDPEVAMAAHALLSAPPMLGARRGRLDEELAALEEAPRWLVEEKRDIVEAAGPAGLALYTPVGEPAARAHARLHGSLPAPLGEARAERGEEAVVFTAGVEAHDYRDILTRLRLGGARLRVASIPTDPVSGAFYLLLAVRLWARGGRG